MLGDSAYSVVLRPKIRRLLENASKECTITSVAYGNCIKNALASKEGIMKDCCKREFELFFNCLLSKGIVKSR